MHSTTTSGRVARASVLATACLALLLWLCSYSWIVGFTPPTSWIDAETSPWLVAEYAAVGAGSVSLCLGLLVAWRSRTPHRRAPLCAAVLGAFVVCMTLLSLNMPA